MSIQIDPPPHVSDLPYELQNWLDSVYNILKNNPYKIQGYFKADLTTAKGLDASQWEKTPATGSEQRTSFTSLIYVHDATGGASLAYSNGSNWISVLTGAAV